jgi:hypothetical protein
MLALVASGHLHDREKGDRLEKGLGYDGQMGAVADCFQ